MDKLKVLIVEDEAIIAWDLKRIIEGIGCEVLPIAPSADAAVEQARIAAPGLVLMDISLKGRKTGIDAAMEIRAFSQSPIIFLTGNSHLISEELLRVAQAQGIYTKPPTEAQLAEMLVLAGWPGKE